MIDCTTCKKWRWDTGTTFGGWCAQGHQTPFLPPAQAPFGVKDSGWMRRECPDYAEQTGPPIAKARPNLTLFEGEQNE